MKRALVTPSPSQPETLEPTPVVGFRILQAYGDKLGTHLKHVNYKPAKLHDNGKWFVYYSWRLPNGKMERYKVYEGINGIHDLLERRIYAATLIKAVDDYLAAGINPKDMAHEKTWTINQALNYFKQKLQERGLRKRSIQTYESCVKLIRPCFGDVHSDIKKLTPPQCRNMLDWAKKKNGWSNATYNNILTQCKAIFNYFVEQGIIINSPFTQVRSLKHTVTRNLPFDDETWNKIRDNAPEDLLRFMLFLYHTATRPNEARQLRYSDILRDRKLLRVPGDLSKNKKDGFVPVSDQFLNMYSGEGVIFGVSTNHFSQKFLKLKNKLGLEPDHTLYSIKHTRAVHLAEAGASPYSIMQLFRHHSIEMTMTYLRGLGLTVGREGAEKGIRF